MARTRRVTRSNPTNMQDEREADWTLNEINKSAAAIEVATKVRLAPELSLYVLRKKRILEKDKIDKEEMEKINKEKNERKEGEKKETEVKKFGGDMEKDCEAQKITPEKIEG